MAHPYLRNAMLVFSLFPAGFGLGHVFIPDTMTRLVGFPEPTTLADRNMKNALQRMTGIRNVGVSYLLYLLWTTNNERLMALGLLVAIGMSFGDGLISHALIGGGEMNHWGFLPVLVGVSAGLLGWY